MSIMSSIWRIRQNTFLEDLANSLKLDFFSPEGNQKSKSKNDYFEKRFPPKNSAHSPKYLIDLNLSKKVH